jgi:hypothetical protein
MRCFEALRAPAEAAEGLLPLRPGDVIIHLENADANGYSIGVCRSVIGYYSADHVAATELPASADDVAVYLEIQRGQAGRRDSAASFVSASSSSATAATVEASREHSRNPRPSFGDSNAELASFLHSVRGNDDTDVSNARNSIQSSVYAMLCIYVYTYI